MTLLSSFLSVLSMISTLAGAAAQDANTMLFPSAGNGSGLEAAGRFEPAPPPEMTRPPEILRPFTMATNQFLPGNSFTGSLG